MRIAMYVARAVLIAVVVVGFALTSWASAPADKGTFATLSAGDQKVVRALFEAQTKGGATQPLTLDQIAAMKPARGAGWGDVFKAMKKQGLLSQKNLGEVVTSYERRHPEVASKPVKPEKPAKPAEKPSR
jgi:hypothetical protein